MNILALRIKELREDKELSQKELAKCLGVSGMAVSRWERSLRVPDAFILRDIALYFNVPTDYLVGLVDFY